MGPETSSAAASSSTTSSPGGKRSRDPEDEVYLDNLHSHKRYLSEIMASSLNGLTVGDPLPENLMESPARSEGMLYLRDDMLMQYSPMSEDSDDSRFCDATINTSSSQADSAPSSPVSPYRYQRPLSGFYSAPSTSSYSSYGCSATTITCSQPRQRGSDSEGRFPSSPSDICHSADLRRAALLRSVQMRTHPPGPPSFELSFGSGQEPVHNMETEERSCSYMKSLVDERTHPPGPPSFELSFGSGQEPVHNMEAEERSCSYMKSLVDERDYQIEECSSMGMAEPEFNHQKSCRVLDVNVKEDNSVD